jgi:hypothetical protein
MASRYAKVARWMLELQQWRAWILSKRELGSETATLVLLANLGFVISFSFPDRLLNKYSR